jgi:hypothetical protein
MGLIPDERDMRIVGDNLFRINPIAGIPNPILIVDDETGIIFQAVVKSPECVYYRLLKEGEEIGWEEDETRAPNM